MRNILKSNWLNLAVILGATVFGWSQYSQLPDPMVTRFNWGGEPHGHLSKPLALSLLPALMFFTVVIVPMLVRLSPKGYQMAQSWVSIFRINLAITVSLSILYVGIVLTNEDSVRYPIFPFLNLTCISLLILFGNFLSKLEQNVFVGIRTPWSLISAKNWFATHRFGAKVCVATGVVLLVGSLFGIPFTAVLFGFIAALFSPFIYSFWFFQKYETNGAVS